LIFDKMQINEQSWWISGKIHSGEKTG